MPVCKACENEVDELKSVRIDGRSKKLCQDCAEAAEGDAHVREASEGVVQGMMGFKGRR